MRARLASVLHWCLCDNRPMSPSTIAILNSVKKAVESSGRSVGLPPFTMCPEGPGEPTERGESTGWLQGSRRPGPPSPSPSKHFCLLSLNKGLWGLGVTGSKTILFMMEDLENGVMWRPSHSGEVCLWFCVCSCGGGCVAL